jgi:3-oxoacyl-[acyl-carrier protein] reductase
VDDLARAEVAREVPLGRVGESADLGSLVAFLCSAQAGYLTGLSLAVDGAG